MSLRIRRARLESDGTELMELLRRHLSPRADSRRFEWLYCACPHGAARAWLACESQTGAAVGAAAAFPRKMYFDGVERMGWVLGDFCFEERYRSLGPALQLQRVCLEAAGEAPFEFCYDFPSLSMMAVYKRLGISQTGTLVRWVKPLRLEPKLEPIVHSKKLARMLGAIGNVAMRWRGSQRDDSACDLALHPGACSAEFTALDQQLRECPGIFTARTAEYLNWRYLAHPGESYEILAARREGELVGYAVFSQDGEEARIVDLCSPHEPDVIAHLLAGVLQLLTARGVATVDMVAGSSHPWSALFRRAGFWRREESPVVAYTPNGALPFDSASLATWHLMQGERDS